MNNKGQNKEKLIIENFSKIFNKIKRLDEQEVNEIDYNALYHKMDNTGDPTEKAGGIPKYINKEYIDNWIKSAKENLGKEGYTQEYLDKLIRIKQAFVKQENGEPLSDQEKQILRYIKTGKAFQRDRIKFNSYDKLRQNYLDNFKSPLDHLVGQTFDGTIYKPTNSGWDKTPTPVKVIGAGKLQNGGSGIGIYMTFPVIVNKYRLQLAIYYDGSQGLSTMDGKGISGMEFSIPRKSELTQSALQILKNADNEITKSTEGGVNEEIVRSDEEAAEIAKKYPMFSGHEGYSEETYRMKQADDDRMRRMR